jgi:Na+-driven multidrug efflux pump
MLAILSTFGTSTVAAFVIARRIWGVMNTPGWGFGLASSSLSGQALGQGKEALAEAYGYDIIRFSVATYAVSAIIIAVFAERLVLVFTGGPGPEVPIAINLIYAACLAVLFQGVSGAAVGPLDAAGDTRVPFLSQLLGMFGGSIPLAYVGSVTFLGHWGLYLAFVAETTIPAAINYWRFTGGRWKAVSRQYRPEEGESDAEVTAVD